MTTTTMIAPLSPDARVRSQATFFWVNMIFLVGVCGLSLLRLASL